MQVKFGAVSQLGQVKNFYNPVTQQPDELSEQMAYTILPELNDPLTNFVLNNTRDELVVSGKRVQYTVNEGLQEGFEVTIKRKELPNHPAGMGMTYGFNPFISTETGKNLMGLQTAKTRILNEIIMQDQYVKQVLADQPQ